MTSGRYHVFVHDVSPSLDTLNDRNARLVHPFIHIILILTRVADTAGAILYFAGFWFWQDRAHPAISVPAYPGLDAGLFFQASEVLQTGNSHSWS